MRVMSPARAIGQALCLLCVGWWSYTSVAGAVVEDIFGRDVSTYGLTVVDWEGYMANPAIEFSIAPPPGALLPVRVSMRAREPRLYFDLPSQAGPDGPSKELALTNMQPVSVAMGIFPVRLKQDGQAALSLVFVDAGGRRGVINLPVHIVAVAGRDHSRPFPITLDFSEDRTGFFEVAAHREAVQQAAADWAFYLQDMPVRPVAAGAEQTWIFEPSGFKESHLATNRAGYRGYLVYAYGIHGPEIRSGGEPSAAGGFQSEDDGELPFRRSGGLEVEIRGNYNTRGWLAPIPDEQWWKATNLNDVPNDLYSIVHHEIGHALFFNPANRSFPRNGTLKNDAVRAYFGSDPRIDSHDHFDGCVDLVSLHGAFGNEYHGKTPYGRWLITKFDLLCAQAVGYRLRRVGPLLPLAIRTEQLPSAKGWHPYKSALEAEGGIPVYDWEMLAGKLPIGLYLDRFTGQITGTPRQVGTFRFTIKVRDYNRDSAGKSRELQLEVRPS